MCVYIYVYIYTHIYIYRERERERQRGTHRERRRERHRERERERETLPKPLNPLRGLAFLLWASGPEASESSTRHPKNAKPSKKNEGALIILAGFWGIFCYNYNKERPKLV